MEFADKELKCSSCGAEFVFTAGEQQFFHSKGYTNEPKRCRICRSNTTGLRSRRDTSVSCADCGRTTTVPFQPSQNRPVYCAECFAKQKKGQSAEVHP